MEVRVELMTKKLEIDLRFEKDGILSFKTGKVPDEVHKEADDFLEELKAELGECETVPSRAGHVHHHGHGHVHSHEHET